MEVDNLMTNSAYAFNLGSDARCYGRPHTANPYSHATERTHWDAWRMGWDDVDKWWGLWCRRGRCRWAAKALPEVGAA